MRLLKKIPVHPTFFLLFIWFVISGQVLEFFMLTFVVLVHEAGHYLVAKGLRYKLDSFYLAPYGVALNYKEEKFASNDEIKIALAGPICSLVLSFVIVGIWWLFPGVYGLTYQICGMSLFLGLFNLLPAYPLDGGRVFVSALSEKMPRKKALKISMCINGGLCILFFVAFIITCFVNYNPTFALMVVFLLGGIMESKFESKYQQVNLYNKKVKDFSHVKTLAVSEEVTLGELLRAIDGSKLTVFYILSESGKTRVLTEKAVLSFCMKEPISRKIKELKFK